MTLADIRTRAYRMLGVDPTEPVFWTDAQMNRWINDAYLSAARHTKALEIRYIVTPTATEGSYTMSGNVGQIFRATYDGYKINPITTWEMNRLDPDWESRSGLVSFYTIDTRDDRVVRLYKKPTVDGDDKFTTEFGVIIEFAGGSDTFTFSSEFGTIIDASGTGSSYLFETELGVTVDLNLDHNNLEVWAVKHPDRMVLDTDSPELPAHSHIALAFEGAARALRKRGDSYNPQKADAYAKMATDYYLFLRSLVSNRAPESLQVVGSRARYDQAIADPTDQVITES
jgi:hypothetical protein